MEPIVEVLARIATSLETKPDNIFLETTTGQFTILVLGVVFGALVTYFMRKKLVSEERRRFEDEKEEENSRSRELLIALLGDEIVCRWFHMIDKDLGSYLASNTEESIAKCCNTTFDPKDLYIFRQCAENITFSTVLNDNALVSRIIYVHILSHDLVDEKNALKKECEKKAEGSASNDNVELIWKNLKEIYLEINDQMILIYSLIENDYSSYINSGDFSNIKEIDKDEVRNHINDAAKKRHCA